MQPGDNLPQLGVGELAGDGGGNNRIDMVFLIVPALFYHINDIEDIGFIGDGAKGALIDAGTAGNAGIVINSGGLILIHGDGLDLAGVLAGPLAVYNGGIRADPGATWLWKVMAPLGQASSHRRARQPRQELVTS